LKGQAVGVLILIYIMGTTVTGGNENTITGGVNGGAYGGR
jgi:hypothetical protein